MNPVARRTGLLISIALFSCAAGARAGNGKSAVDDCVAVGRTVKEAIAKKPTALLPIVQSALTANEDCTCEIVRAAVLAAEAEPTLVREIVITALNTTPARAAEIAECAVTAAPKAVDAVKSALHSVFGSSPPGVGGSFSIPGIFLVPPQPSSPTNPGP